MNALAIAGFAFFVAGSFILGWFLSQQSAYSRGYDDGEADCKEAIAIQESILEDVRWDQRNRARKSRQLPQTD